METLGNNIALIPARGGSVGVPNKNLREFCGKPLIAWSIEKALSIPSISRVIVSTDSLKIASVAKNYGAEVPFLRPKQIATSNASIDLVIRHTLEFLDANGPSTVGSIVLLFPTNPLRTEAHIVSCLDLYYETNADCVFTVNEIPSHYHPSWLIDGNNKKGVTYFNGTDLREGPNSRQEFSKQFYAKNDLVFVVKPKNLLQSKVSIFGENNKTLITDKIFDGDINDEQDWIRTELIFKSMRTELDTSEG